MILTKSDTVWHTINADHVFVLWTGMQITELQIITPLEICNI